jgi:hypothetical protein
MNDLLDCTARLGGGPFRCLLSRDETAHPSRPRRNCSMPGWKRFGLEKELTVRRRTVIYQCRHTTFEYLKYDGQRNCTPLASSKTLMPNNVMRWVTGALCLFVKFYENPLMEKSDKAFMPERSGRRSCSLRKLNNELEMTWEKKPEKPFESLASYCEIPWVHGRWAPVWPISY